MTHPSTIARDSAQHCEAKKHALRQTQDGIVVAFVLHPNDVPPSLQLAPLGTRYMLALVEIADDETPAQPRKVGEANTPELSPRTTGQNKTTPAPERVASARATPRKWDEITPAQQAGIRCNEPAFQQFLRESEKGNWDGCWPTVPAEKAAWIVRKFCEVQSRSEIREGTVSAETWSALEGRYRAWQLAPGVGAA